MKDFAANVHSVKRHAKGSMHFQFSAPSGRVYLEQASTKLVDWEAVGTATVKEDGPFEFEDTNAAQDQCLFHWVVGAE